MVKSRRVFTREFKLAAVKELESGKPLGYVARQLEVNPNMLHRCCYFNNRSLWAIE